MSVDEKLTLRCRENSLLTVLINLLSNSFEAIGNPLSFGVRKEWVCVEADVSPDGAFAEIRVKDSGPGVPKEQRDRLFHKKMTTKVKGKGTGLGLRFVSKILEAEGGSIIYDDKATNTTFVLRLPCVRQDLSRAENQELGDSAAVA